MQPDSWIKKVISSTELLNKSWFSRSEFKTLLDSIVEHPRSPLVKLLFNFEGVKDFKAFKIEAAVSHPSCQSNGHWERRLDEIRHTLCRVSYWKKTDVTDFDTASQEAISHLLLAFWQASLRTPVAGIPDVKRMNQVSEFAEVTLKRHSSRSSALLFCDLDKFKTFNDKHGMPEGDNVIRIFGSILEGCAVGNGIVMHNGGDEFLVLLPEALPIVALQTAKNIADSVVKWKGENPIMEFSVSIGISISDEGEYVEFEELMARAEAALKSKLKAEGRNEHPLAGSARFAEDPVDIVSDQLDPNTELFLGACFIESSALNRAPFYSVCMNGLTLAVQNAKTGGVPVQQSVDDYLAWLKTEASTVSLNVRAFGFGCATMDCGTMSLSALDMAFAITHGLICLMGGPTEDKGLSIFCDDGGTLAKIVAANGETLWQSGIGKMERSIQIVAPFVNEGNEVPKDAARAVLIQIGHSQLNLPKNLFSAVMVVDDRPSTGGGLPDFWEITIARLVAHIRDTPRACAIYVLGNHANAPLTVTRLKGIGEWDSMRDQLADRLPVSATDILAASTRLKDSVFFPVDEANLLANLHEALLTAGGLAPDMELEPSLYKPLHTIKTKEEVLLNVRDGCRVETLANAYPIVLQILRSDATDKIQDHAGLELRELFDFKLVLTSPLKDRIPAYFAGQEDELEKYYINAFQTPEKLFGRALKIGNQRDVVLKHVHDILKRTEQRVATRRAILVIPHSSTDGGDCAPLGLTSIRIIPRFIDNRIILSYSFSWRTVEALIGFPYSVYGSIRYCEDLTAELTKDLGGVKDRVEIGCISYVAHSLHLFVDEYGLKIARNIVHAASD